ncbi:MAG TPA: hypothetical protein ENF18_08965 [candidate division WOR-3 bacterium]|uniref:HEAT repeat domain-containing protein n=1 Tax=candidate division WOR-3 bacterium TaxID=2052148 RepID=A0A7C0ZIS2_UNCW3|nr:hypothetical protein [candidate division WOR-3 bacterium]
MNEKRFSRLKETLKTGGLNEKLSALEELKEEDSAKVNNLLLTLLSSESWTLRNRVCEILAERGEKLGDRLINILNTGVWYSRAAAARTLGLIGKISYIPELLKYKDDSNEVVREEVRNAIKNIVEKNEFNRIQEEFDLDTQEMVREIAGIEYEY